MNQFDLLVSLNACICFGGKATVCITKTRAQPEVWSYDFVVDVCVRRVAGTVKRRTRKTSAKDVNAARSAFCRKTADQETE